MRKFALRDMSFVEFRERMTEQPVIILPLGSQEEQGPQAPMGDYMLSEKIAGMVAEAAEGIVAPVLPFGYADVFRCVPGGIQLRPEVFAGVLEDMITAFLDHGLERIVVLNGHTGNTALINQVVRKLKRERGVLIPSINIWKIIPPAVWERAHGAKAKQAQGHGADPIYSVYMHFYPELLRPDLVKASAPQKAFDLPTNGMAGVAFEGGEVLVPLDAMDVNADGMIGGDAGVSTAEAGAVLVGHIVGYCASFVRYFRGCDPRSFAAPAGGA